MLRIEKVKGMKQAIVYGCGNFGKQCISYMKEKNIAVWACCDSDKKRWGKEFEGYPIILPDELENNRDTFVIVAIEKSNELVRKLLEAGFKTCLFYKILDEKEIYRIADGYEILGCRTKEQLKQKLKNQKRIILVGSKKRREDFKYIFDWISIDVECEKLEAISSEDSDFLYIYCEENIEELQERYKGDNIEIVKAEEFFPLVGDKEETDFYAAIWCLKTFYAEQEEQMPCVRPFTNALINSNFELHFCCGDWAMGLGNILDGKSLEKLWTSDLAKIFRLSMINRTYSFCHKERCVHLKSNPIKKEMERLADGIYPEPMPLYLEIGIDKTCNLYCKSCRDCVIAERGERKEKIERAKEIIMNSSWTERCNVLLLGGQGEVFASQPYQEIMLGFEGRRKSLALRSNGVLFDEERFQKLKEKYEELDVIISVDAATRETYNKLRRSHDNRAWDKLQKNLQMLSEKRKICNLKFFQINMCVQRDNYQEMADFVQMGANLGVDKIYLTAIRNWGTFTKEEFEEVRIFDGEKNLKREVQEELDKVKALSVKPVIEIAF